MGDAPSTTCGCACHVGPYATCDIPGGCGSTGCGRNPAGNCAACGRRDSEYGLVCEPCRRWFPIALASIPQLATEARDELIPADDSGSRPVLVCRACGLTVPHTADGRHARHNGRPEYDHSPNKKWHGGWDKRHLVNHAGGPAPSLAPDIIVTGGDGEAPVPLDLHLHDLLADVIRDGGRPIDATGDNWVQALDVHPRRIRVDHGTKGFQTTTVLDRKPARDTNGYKVMIPAGDQIGAIPIAQVLDQEVRAWIDAGAPGSRWRPTPTIPDLCDWLAKRLDWACDNYTGIDELATTLGRLRGQLMGAVGEIDTEAELCDGIACNRCDLRMLYRREDGTGDVECQNPDCLKVFSAAQYRDLVKYLGEDERAARDPAEVTELLRARTTERPIFGVSDHTGSLIR